MNKKIGLISLVAVVAIVGLYLIFQQTNKPERQGELTYTHELGTTTLNKNPKRVIVFDYGMADALAQLDVEIIALPKATLPSYLEAVYAKDKYTDVGSLKEPNFEVIGSLNPDLILISSRQSELYADFDRIAPTLYLPIDNTNYLDSFRENLRIFGEIFEKEDEVETAIDAVQTKVESINAMTEGKDINALIVMVVGGKISAYGEGSRFGIIHKEFGIPAVDKTLEASTHGNAVSNEYIAQKNPDYLFVIDRDSAIESGNQNAKNIIENELVKTTKAYQNGNIIYLDSEVWYLTLGGIESTNKMADEVANALE